MKIASYDDLYNALDGYKIGITVTLTVDQDGKSRKVRIVLVKSD
jgi:S1-C subfamily serine protease